MVLPSVGRGGETARPEKAHDCPEVNRGGREQHRNQGQADRNQAEVQGVIALPDAGEVQSARMGYVERDEGHQGTRRRGGNAVPQHAHPRIDLRNLFPPVVLNDEIGSRRDCPTDKSQR